MNPATPAEPSLSDRNIILATAFIFLVCLLKYYPLEVNPFVFSQYLWSYADSAFRRGLLTNLAAVLHGFDRSRIVGTVEAFSTIGLIIDTILLVWVMLRLPRDRIVRAAFLLFLLSGFVPHILSARGSQDGFVLIAIFLSLRMALGAAPVWAGVWALIAVLLHEAALPFLLSGAAVILVVTQAERLPSIGSLLRSMPETLRDRRVIACLAVAAVATIIGVGVVRATSVSQDAVVSRCEDYRFLRHERPADFAAGLRGRQANSLPWIKTGEKVDGLCGAQFTPAAANLAALVVSAKQGILFAPCVLLVLFIIGMARGTALGWRLILVAAILFPLSILALAWDIPRFWTYTNAIAFLAIWLFRGMSREDPPPGYRLVSGGLLLVWSVLFVVLFQYSPTWEREPTLLPNAVSTRFLDVEEFNCAIGLSRRGC